MVWDLDSGFLITILKTLPDERSCIHFLLCFVFKLQNTTLGTKKNVEEHKKNLSLNYENYPGFCDVIFPLD